MSKSHHNAVKPATIGPGSYDPKINVESAKMKLPTYSFGFKINNEVISDTPAPNAYYSENVTTMFKSDPFGSTTKSGSFGGSLMKRTSTSSMISR